MGAYSCCDIDLGIAAGTTCYNVKPGITDARISCAKQVTYTESACPTGVVTDIATVDDSNVSNPSFYEIELMARLSGQAWNLTYDEESGNSGSTETITIVTNVKTRSAYCALQSYIGQCVTLLWKENGTDRWYASGRSRDLWVTDIQGGTGTNENLNITITLSGINIQKFFTEVFDTDAATTQALIDSVTV